MKINKEDIPVNPVGRARVIVDTMTNDSTKQNKLLGIITRELTGEEINNFYNILKNNGTQLKLEL